MENNKKKIISVVVALFGLGLVYFLYQHFTYVKTDNAEVNAHTVLLAPRVGGYIREVNVTEGQIVKKGDLLVQIDDRDYVAALTSSKSELLSLEAKKNDAEKNYRRIKDLFSKSVVSTQQYDTATANYNEIRAKYDSASAHVQQAELNLEFTQLRAPSDGIIARKSAEIGQLAAPGAVVVGFVSSEDRWVTANLKETEIEHVKPGQKVKISVDAFPSQKFTGTVDSLSSATGATFSLLPPDNATGNFTKVVQRVPVKITFDSLSDEDKNKLQAGLSALVKIKIK
jgi:membrane fusion protein (multidrug efflux system)